MKSILAMAIVLAAAQCGLTEDYDQKKFQLTVDETLEMKEAQTTVLVLTVVNASAQVTFDVTSLPSFAQLEGNKITFNPRRFQDAGEYPIVVTANDGANTASKNVTVRVSGQNSAPELTFPAFSTINQGQCNAAQTNWDKCAPPFFSSSVSDHERDTARMELEIVPFDQELTGNPTYTSDFLSDYNEYNYMKECITVPDLQVGQKYRVAMRWAEQGGLASEWMELCKWVGYEYPGLQ
jgi:hypothetical protein